MSAFRSTPQAQLGLLAQIGDRRQVGLQSAVVLERPNLPLRGSPQSKRCPRNHPGSTLTLTAHGISLNSSVVGWFRYFLGFAFDTLNRPKICFSTTDPETSMLNQSESGKRFQQAARGAMNSSETLLTTLFFCVISTAPYLFALPDLISAASRR